MASITGLKSGFFTDIDVVDSIAINGNVGTANQVLTSDGTNTSYQDPTPPAVSDLLTAGTGIDITATGNPETISTNVKSLVLSGTAVVSTPQTFNPNANGGSQTITINDTDTQLNLTADLPIVIDSSGGGLNKNIELDIDTNTMGVSGGELEVLKVPETLTFTGYDTGTFDGSSALSINLVDTDTTYQGGTGISIDTATNPDTINCDNIPNSALQNSTISGKALGSNLSTLTFYNSAGGLLTSYNGADPPTSVTLDGDTTYTGGKNITVDTTPATDEIDLDDDLTAIDSITMTSTGGTTALTGNNYPSNPTPMTYFDLSSATNVFPTNLGGVGVGGLGGVYKDEANGFLYRFLLPSDFLNDNDSSGYARSVIADSSNHGAQQCYAGTQYYAFFTIPDGYYFSGFRVNLVNSVGTAQGTTPTGSFYTNIYTKTINSNLTTVGSTKGFNTDNLGYTITSGYSATWDINDPITIGAIHCFRNSWSSSFYNRGGWIQYTEGTPGGSGK